MIGAHETTRVAFAFCDEHSAVLADGRHRRDLAALGACDDQRLADMLRREIVAGFLDPGFAADTEPFLGEQGLLFELEKFRIDIARGRKRLGLRDIQYRT
jgi:hypothetical protein